MWESMGRRGKGERRDGSGRAEEAAMTTRRWFEFVSTRYRSSGSICPRPSFCVSPSPSPTCSLRRARYLDSPASFSVAPYRSRFFFVPRFVPDTRRADPLYYPLSSLPPVPLVLSRQPHRFTFYVPPAVSLVLSLSDLSIHLPPAHASTAYQSVSVPRSVSAFSHRFSRSPSLAPVAPPRARFSRSFFRCSTASRSSLR